MRVAPGFIVRQIAGDTVAIPSGESAHRLSGLISLNESGKFLFEMLQTEQTESSLIQAMLENFEVDAITAKQDVVEFISILQECNLLV
jgi:methyltransferase-like protein